MTATTSHFERSEATATPAPPADEAVVPQLRTSAVKDPPTRSLKDRVASIDAYRGMVMLLMMGEVLEFPQVYQALAKSRLVVSAQTGLPETWAQSASLRFWEILAFCQTHVPWIGASLHDMIQPSFTFLVGVALPFSLARRSREGQPQWVRTLHAFWRALVLVLLGVFLRSMYRPQTYWTFEDTLTQIGLGYGILYCLALFSRRVQWIALAVILVGYWIAFAAYPLPGAGFNWSMAGVTSGTPEVLSGFAEHWGKNVNLAWRFDTWFLNLFPREKPFTNNEGGYATLSFIPTLATMILGLLAGEMLRRDGNPWKKIGWLYSAGLIALAAGVALNFSGICPVVKRIWTPSWVLYSGGWCFVFLATFYLIMDIARLRRWAFWMTIVGMNSIAAYLIANMWERFIYHAIPRHLGANWNHFAAEPYRPLVHGAVILLIEWLILLWMYRRKIFLRV